MSTVSSKIQRAISEAIYDQILPHIQATLRSGQMWKEDGKFRQEDRNLVLNKP